MAVISVRELRNQLQQMIRNLSPDRVEPILLEGAETMASAIRDRAPQGPTGNLKEAIKAKSLRRRGSNPAPAIAAVDRKKAPHAWLVQHGTKDVRIAKRGRFRGRSFGKMPANKFFSKGRNASRRRVLTTIVQKLRALIEEGVR